MSDAIEEYRNQISLTRTEIKNLRQQLLALKYEHYKEMKVIKAALNELSCSSCANPATEVKSPTQSQPSTSQQTNSKNISYQPIGHIETSFMNKRGVPRQPTVMAQSKGTLLIDTNVFSNPDHALSGLEEFSHMWIIFDFHARESNNVFAKVAPPRLGGERRGVFSTRAPLRPCPIGLSLVKIQAVEGNKVHFLGVDMVNGTPVLDIKPYIPQYDYPTVYGDRMSTFERPPTEGISDAAETMANMNLDDDDSVSPRLSRPTAVAASTPVDTLENNLPSPMLTPISPSPNSPTGDTLVTPRNQRGQDTERGAPDGQERYTPPQSANFNIDGIRVAPWVTNPITQTFEVRFMDDVNLRIVDLIGDRAQAFKNNLQGLLSQDPRSNYVRTRYPDHEYSCVLEDLSISCVFDSSSATCTIVAVRNAAEMQS